MSKGQKMKMTKWSATVLCNNEVSVIIQGKRRGFAAVSRSLNVIGVECSDGQSLEYQESSL